MAVQYCNYDIKGTLAVIGTSTFTGAATFGSSINMSDNQPINFGGQTMFTHTGSVTSIGDSTSSSVLNISGGDATFTGDIKQSNRIVLQDNGTIQWGNTADYGNLTWDTGYALIYGQSGKGIKLGTNGSTLALELDTSQNATFAGDITVSGGDITLGGTGRIQGVDTVSASTDAANKAYVDAHVSPAGTYLPLAGGTMATTAKIYFYNTSQYIHANSSNDLTIASGDDINYLSNFNRFYTGGVEFARLSGSYDSWIANGTNSKLGINKNSGINYNLDVEGTLRTTSNAIFEGSVSIGTTNTSGLLNVHKSGSGTDNTIITEDDARRIYIGRDSIKATDLSNNAALLHIQQNDGDTRFGGDATVDGDLTVSGGDITLSGTGRIQGIDTVSASTDAANKAYVDAHVSPAGTYLPLIGGTMSGSIGMGDNDIDGIDELKFSSGTKLGDDGGTSFVSLTYADSGDGGLKVTDNDGHIQGYLYGDGGATSSFGLLDGTGSWAVRCLENEYVELRYDNSTKLNTLTDGVTISGKLGIGTSFPGTEGYSFAEDLVIKGGASASDGAGITIAGNGKRYGIIAFGDAADVNAGEIFYDHNVNAMYFRTNGSNSVVYINSAGKVNAGAATSSGDGSSTLTTKGYVDAQIATIPSGLNFQGNWNASTNSPTLASGTGTPGFYYNVSVAGSTNLDGETDWQVGDWAVFVEAGATDKWEKIDNTSALTGVGVNGRVTFWSGTNTLASDAGLTYNSSTDILTASGGVLWSGGGSAESNSAYDNMITAFSDSGSSTITLTLTQQDGGTLTTSFSNPQGTVTGTGATGRVAFWNGTSAIASSSNLYWDNGTAELGIGTSSPTTSFTIASGHGTTRANLFYNGGGTGSNNASIDMWASEPGVSYNGSGIGSNIVGSPYYGRQTTTQGQTYIRFIDGQFEVYTGTNSSGTASTATRRFYIEDNGLATFSSTPAVGTRSAGDNTNRAASTAFVTTAVASAGSGTFLPLIGGTMTGDIDFNDGIEARFGNSQDLTIQSVGDQSYIQNYTGNLNIVQNANDSDIIFKSDNGSGGTTTYFYLDGSGSITRVSTNFRADDSVKLQAGSNGDFSMFHNGTHSYLDNDTGNLYIRNKADDKDIIFQSDDGSGGLAEYFRVDGSFEKTVFSKDIFLNDNVKALFGNSSDLQIYHDGSGSYVDNYTGVLQFTNYADDSDIIFKSDDGSGGTATYFRVDGGAVETRFLKSTRHFDNVGAYFGDSADLQIYHDGSNSYIQDTGTGDLKLLGTNLRLKNGADTITFLEALSGGAVSIYHNGSKRFETTSSGVTVTGDLTVTGGDISLGGTGRIQGIDTVSAGTDAANKDYVDTAVAGSGSGTVTSVSSATTSQLTVSQSSPAPALSIVTAAVTNGGTALATGNQIYDATTTRLASYLPLAGGTMTGNVRLNDNVQLQIGSSNDAYITHNATDTFFVNSVGKLEITNDAVDKSIIFKANESSGAENYLGLLPSFPGVFVYKDLLLAQDGNGGKIKLGQNQDLQLFHDGNHSYIDSNNTGDLYIRSLNDDIVIQAYDDVFIYAANGEDGIKVIGDGAVELYYNNSKRFETTVNGIALPQGNNASPSISRDGDSNTGMYWGASDELNFSTAGINRLIIDSNGLTVNGNVSLDEDVVLGASSSIVLDDTPTASTASGSGTIVKWSVSVSTTAGTLYVIKTDGGWTTADADSEAKSTAMAAIALGSNATSGMLLQGFFYKASHGFSIGAPLYISNTAGAFSNTRPTGTGDYVRIIGYATSTNYIYFDPDKTWVKID